MTELQQQGPRGGGGGAGGAQQQQQQEEMKQQQQDMKNSILSQVLTQEARARCKYFQMIKLFTYQKNIKKRFSLKK